jgi:hypothetical protein
MKKVILQIWEESTGGQCRADGCSLHIDIINRNKFVDSVYNNRQEKDIPESYERIVGLPIEVFVTDDLFNLIFKDKTVRLMTHQMNNLLTMEDIIYND